MRKVLSFVLVLALVLSSFSMAFAGTSTEIVSLSDIEGNANQSAIEVNYDLGIVTGNPDGTFQPEKAVTRAEFAAMVTRALAIPQSALAGYANTNFKDTTGYTWAVPYLAFCNSKGIMLGDGAGNAMPGKTITVNEAVTMALRAIGYTANSSELVGVWPANYVTKAQELKMYDDVAKDATGVDKANAAQIIYNTLTVQKVAVNSDGETKKIWDEEPANNFDGIPTTLLSAGLNCEAYEDVVVGYDSPSTDDSVINIAKNFGRYGTVYTNDDDEIVAFISDDDTIVGRFVKDGSDIVFKTTDEEKDYNVAKDVTFTAISYDNAENYSGASSTDVTDFTDKNGLGVDTDEYVLSVDLSGKTIKHIYSATKWGVTTAEQIEAADITDIEEDQSLLGDDFYLDDNDEIDYTQFQLVGIKSLKDLKEDNVVYVYSDKDGIRKIEVGTEVVEGTVKNFKKTKDDVATKFAIGANTYKNAEEVVNGVAGNGDIVTIDEVSEDLKAYIDARGYVFDFESTTSADNFAVVEKYSGSGINEEAKLMLADGTEKTFGFDLDGKISDNIAVPASGSTTVEYGKATYNLIGYGLNSDGEISEINTNSAFIANNGSNYVTLSSINLIRWNDGEKGSATVADDVVVFTYDGEDYDVSSIDRVETEEALLTAGGEGVTLLFDDGDDELKQDEVVAIIIDDQAAKGGVASYAVFNETNKTSNDDGDAVWELVGFKDAEKLNALTDDESGIFGGVTSSTKVSGVINPVYDKNDKALKVQLFKVKVDANGLVTAADLVDTGKVGSKNDADMVVVKNKVVSDIDGRKSIKDTDNNRYAFASNVVIYQVNDDEDYKVYNGSLKEDDVVTLYELDEEDGYEVVFFYRP
jgi:S-layer family protein